MSKSTRDRILANTRRIMDELGLSQAEVVRRAQAKDHKLDAPYLNHILRGRVNPQGKLDAIAAGLGVDPVSLTMPIAG